MSESMPEKVTKRAKRAAIAIASSLVGIGVTAIASAICIYDSFFRRIERPDSGLSLGEYCYDRVREWLPRECFVIPSGKNNLAAYYYPASRSRGLAVLSHGYRAGADDYIPLIAAIRERGYSVLAYDVTGVYSSEGESVVGMCQSLCDLDAVLNFLGNDPRFSDMPRVVVGHSWGGYAASSVLALHREIRAAALIAPMNSGATVMIEKSREYAGFAAYAVKPIFDIYQRYLFGDYVDYNGVVGINSGEVPVLIAQGVDDSIITPSGQSITAHLAEITNPSVDLYWGEGSQGSHSGIWHSRESEEYRRTVASRLRRRELELGRALTLDELRALYTTVDHRLYSEVNAELVDLIVATFDKGVAAPPSPS